MQRIFHEKSGTNLQYFQGRMFQNHQIFYDAYKEPFLEALTSST